MDFSLNESFPYWFATHRTTIITTTYNLVIPKIYLKINKNKVSINS